MSAQPEAPLPSPSEPPVSPALDIAADPDEQDFATARVAFLEPERSQTSVLVLLVTMVLFALAARLGEQTWQNVVMLVGVLLFHEAGHWLGMRMFGFQNVQMFFIPFLGAAVSGRNVGAVAWKEALVLLMGPMPGLLLGIGLLAWTAFEPSHLVANVGLLLVVVNAFNLLPMSPLDGGKLFQLLIFSRHRYMENSFSVLACVGMVGMALAMGAWVLGVVSVLIIFSLPRQMKLLYAVRNLRERHPELDREPSALDGPELRTLYNEAKALVPEQVKNPLALRVKAMKDLHHRLRLHPPGVFATLGLGTLWFVGVVATLVGIVLVGGGYTPRQPNWTEYKDARGGFSILMPLEDPQQGVNSYGLRTGRQEGGGTVDAHLWVDLDYSVTYWKQGEMPSTDEARERLLDEVRDALVKQEIQSPREEVMQDKARELAGIPGRHLVISGKAPLGEGVVRTDYWFGLHEGRGFILRAEYDSRLGTPEEAERFLASFRPLSLQ
jgi:Zn-dependent protease